LSQELQGKSFGTANAAQFRSLICIVAYAVLICAILMSIKSVIGIGFVFEQNYNEGWNVYNAERLLNRETVYDNNYWRVNNYPIVSFLVVGGLNSLIRDLLLSGRLVSLLSFVAVGLLAGTITRKFGGDRFDGIFSSGCALGFAYLAAPRWIATDDPQTLAEAIMLGGMACYVSGPITRRRLSWTALLIILAGFTKHNLLAIPSAITLDLAIRSRRHLRFWFIACACIAVAIWAFTVWIAGGSPLAHLLSPRAFSWSDAAYKLTAFLRTFWIPIILTTVFLPLFGRDRMVLIWYGTISVTSATILSGAAGTWYNMFQDSAVFLAITAGLALHKMRNMVVAGMNYVELRKIASVLVPLLFASPILTNTDARGLFHMNDLLQAYRAAEQSFLADAAFISERRALAICESLLLCYYAGQPFTLDPFNSRQYILAGKLDEDELAKRIATHEFAVIQLRGDICDDVASAACHILHYPRKIVRFTDTILYVIDQHYRIDRRSKTGVFYVPK
jgi:hypothetical protein